MFYFDQFHLTTSGRTRSFDLARELVRRLIVDGNRGLVVSAATRSAIPVDWTGDAETLIAAIDALEGDPTQVETWADLEEWRVARVYDAMGDGRRGVLGLERIAAAESKSLSGVAADAAAAASVTQQSSSGAWDPGVAAKQAGLAATSAAVSQMQTQITDVMTQIAQRKNGPGETVARQYQLEEQSRARSALTRLAAALARLDAESDPRALVYFADTMRSNPGDHYLELLGSEARQQHRQVSLGGSEPAFEEVINEAAVRGIRFYTVQGAGLFASTAATPLVESAPRAQLSAPLASSRRFDDAENGLAAFALETGGQVFLGANDGERISGEIRADLACPYLISFDASEAEEDKPLAVRLHIDRPDVELRYRTRVVVQSESRAVERRLAAALLTADRAPAESELQLAVIPTGFEKKRFTALVQVVVTSAVPAATTWDVGVTLISKERSSDARNARLSLSEPGVPLVFETEATFKPGDYRIVALAHEVRTETVVSKEITGVWPDPTDDMPLVTEITVMQPRQAAFVRDGVQRRSGPVVVGSGGWVDPDRPTALLALACRGSRNAAVTATRIISGNSAAPFPPLELSAEDRCMLVADVIPQGTLTSGSFSYSVRLTESERDEVERARTFVALAADDPALIELASDAAPPAP
jgi:hypothetical protein